MHLNRWSAIFILLVSLLSFSAPPLTAASKDISAGAWFGLGPEPQQIQVKRFMQANEALVEECIPGFTAHEFRDYFYEWLKDNPGFLSRPAQTAFSAALIDTCKELKK